MLCKNFNPLPPHGGRPQSCFLYLSKLHFNPLPPHGGRHNNVRIRYLLHHFNPLPPHGGRHHSYTRNGRYLDISIHSLHTEGDAASELLDNTLDISIHSLHTEGDVQRLLYNIITEQFQSTPSTRRETMFARYSINWAGISIHSLHTEGDERHRSVSLHQGHFNPLPPHGGRPFTLYFHGRGYTLFQSTPSTRRETTVV